MTPLSRCYPKNVIFRPRLLIRTFLEPTDNLACDEALLEAAEAGELGAVLRLWESPRYFVALGYTNTAETEVHVERCREANVPILRRCSGGGTVLQGPGCFNYSLIAPIDPEGTGNVESTNRFVMERHRGACERLFGRTVKVAGHTDLVVEDPSGVDLKFSGNAQRRKSRYFLFHGTILLHMDLNEVSRLLRPPSKEPEYRSGRPHSDFVTNVGVTRADLTGALVREWEVQGTLDAAPQERLNALVASRYGRDDWNLRA